MQQWLYVVQVIWQPCDLTAVSRPVWHIQMLCVQWKTPDEGQRNCPKHLEFHSKNKFEKLVRLFGFIIRIYYDARSRERENYIKSSLGWGGKWLRFHWIYCNEILSGLRTNTDFIRTNRVPTENWVPPEYKSETLLLAAICSW